MSSSSTNQPARPTWLWRPVRAVQLALVLAVEAGWLFAWSAVLGARIDPDHAAPLLDLPSIALLLAVGAIATRLALARLSSLRLARAAVVLLGLILTLLPIAAGRNVPDLGGLSARDAVAFALGLVAWWRGIAAGGGDLTLDDVEAGVRRAVVGLATALVLAPSISASTLVGPVLIALFAGLVGLPLARVLDLSEERRGRSDVPLRVSGPWLGMLLGTVTVLLGLALLLAGALTFEQVEPLLGLLAAPLVALLSLVLYAIAVPAGLLVGAFLWLVRQLMRSGGQPMPLPPPDFGWVEELRNQGPGGAPPELLVVALKAALGLTLGALVIWLLVRAVAGLGNWRTADDVEEERDFVWSWSDVKLVLLAWLRALLGRVRSAAKATRRGAPPDGQPGSPGWDARELYRALLRLGARLGRRRAAYETPAEYERALAATPPFGDAHDVVRLLTDVYARARYAEEPPSPAEVAAAKAALERLAEPREHDRS